MSPYRKIRHDRPQILKALWALDVFRVVPEWSDLRAVNEAWEIEVAKDGENARLYFSDELKEIGYARSQTSHVIQQMIFLSFYGLTLRELYDNKGKNYTIGAAVGLPATLFAVVYGLRRYTDAP